MKSLKSHISESLINESVKVPTFLKGKNIDTSELDERDFKKLDQYLPANVKKEIKNIIKNSSVKLIATLPLSNMRGEAALDYLEIYDENETGIFMSKGIPRGLGKVYNYEEEKLRQF